MPTPPKTKQEPVKKEREQRLQEEAAFALWLPILDYL
jgi:hypothetical protein